MSTVLLSSQWCFNVVMILLSLYLSLTISHSLCLGITPRTSQIPHLGRLIFLLTILPRHPRGAIEPIFPPGCPPFQSKRSTIAVALWPGRCCRALSCNLFSFHQHYFWFSRSLQSLFWHKLVRFNQLQTHSADRTLRLRYYDGLAIPAYVSSALANIGAYSVPPWPACCKCV